MRFRPPSTGSPAWRRRSRRSRWTRDVRRRLAGARLDPAREAEIAQEIEQHLEDRYLEMRASGADDDDARRAALEEIQEDGRMRRELDSVGRQPPPPPPLGYPNRRSPLADLLQDAWYAVRMLRRTPGFAALAILTLAIGVRIALGADARRVLRTVIGSPAPAIVAGVLLGIAGAWWATRLIKAFLYRVEPTDPLTFGAVALIITVVGLFACYLPARRALRVDPVQALRAE